MDDPIGFIASIEKVQTLADGGIRVTLDLPETAIAQAAYLMEWRRRAEAVIVECKTVNSNGVEKRRNRKSKRKASQEQGLD